jgi:hypothetical protein
MQRTDCEPLGAADSARRVGHVRATLAATLACVCALAGILSCTATASAEQTLPDGRAWEQVSPPKKNGQAALPVGYGSHGLVGGLIQSSTDGTRIAYVTTGPISPEAEASRAIEGNQVLAVRKGGTWQSTDVLTPHAHGEGLEAGGPSEYRLLSPDLSSALLQPYTLKNPMMEPPLVVPEPKSEELSIYLRNDISCEVTRVGCYTPIVNPLDAPGAQYGEHLDEIGLGGPWASEDLQHVIVKSSVPLTTETPALAEEPLYLYEYNVSNAKGEPIPPAERLKFISFLPASTPAAAIAPKVGDAPGFGGTAALPGQARHAVSSDGSKVIFTGFESVTRKAHGEEETFLAQRLFLRDTVHGQTIVLNRAENPGSEAQTEAQAEHALAHFQEASVTGNIVLFTDTVKLKSEKAVKVPSEVIPPADLYACELQEEHTPYTCKLTDLTAGLKKADVVGYVVASEDGKTVYFVANGVPEGAKRPAHHCISLDREEEETKEGEPKPNGTCQLYVVKDEGGKWSEPKLIAQLLNSDNGDWGVTEGDLSNLTMSASPEGQYLVFMSEDDKAPLFEHNLDAGGHRVEEVYRYDSVTGKTRCLTCGSGGTQVAAFDQREKGLLVDPKGAVWGIAGEEHWLAGHVAPFNAIEPTDGPYQPRTVLGDGRVFFESANPLVSEAPSGVMAVYEYEPLGVGTCSEPEGCTSLISKAKPSPEVTPNEASFLDATPSGEDVFFLSADQLTPIATENQDVYDARVCAAQGNCPTYSTPPIACANEQTCRAPAPAPPAYPTLGTSVFRGPALGPGALPPVGANVGVLHSKEEKKKTLTNAQKLAKALASCRKKYKRSKHRRQSCERSARAKYAKHSSKKKHK